MNVLVYEQVVYERGTKTVVCGQRLLSGFETKYLYYSMKRDKKHFLIGQEQRSEDHMSLLFK